MIRGAGSLGAAAILVVGLSGFACTRDNSRAADNRTADTSGETGALSASPSPMASPADRDTITAGDVAANPTKYVGQRVVVKGSVADIVGTRAFTLDEDRLTADQNLLVLSQGGIPSPDQKKEKVVVSGTVQMFDSKEIKREHSWFSSTPEIEVKYRNRPVVIADSVQTADGREITGSALPASSGETGSMSGSSSDAGHGNRPADSRP